MAITVNNMFTIGAKITLLETEGKTTLLLMSLTMILTGEMFLDDVKAFNYWNSSNNSLELSLLNNNNQKWPTWAFSELTAICSLVCLQEPELFADDISILEVPFFVTDGAPRMSVINEYCPFITVVASDKTNVAVPKAWPPSSTQGNTYCHQKTHTGKYTVVYIHFPVDSVQSRVFTVMANRRQYRKQTTVE